MRFEKKEFRNARLELDGNEYVGCTIISCTFVYRATAPFTLTHNHISGDLYFVFEGAAGDTLTTLKGIWGMGEVGLKMIMATFKDIAPGLKELN